MLTDDLRQHRLDLKAVPASEPVQLQKVGE